MGTRIQRLLHPGGTHATTGQEMADLLKKTLEGFNRGDKWSTPDFNTWQTPLPLNQKPNEASKPSILNKGASADGLVHKALKT